MRSRSSCWRAPGSQAPRAPSPSLRPKGSGLRTSRPRGAPGSPSPFAADRSSAVRQRDDAVLTHPALDLRDRDLEHLDTRIALGFRRHELPAAMVVVGASQHLLDRLLVVLPAATVAPVVLGQLPLLQLVVLAFLEALELLVGGDVQPEL